MPTIKDISRISGISVTQVSRALNNHSDVSQSTKERVRKIAKEIGYVPNRSAQNLVKQTTNTLAIIISGLEKEGGKDNIIYQLLTGMYQFAEEVNYEIALFTTSSAHQKEKSYFEFCKEHNIRGAVLNGLRTDDPYFEELIESDIPCVLIDSVQPDNDRIVSVSVDNVAGSYDAVSYLIQKGHKNIAMINGRPEAEVSSQRLKGYVRALNEHHLAIQSNWIVYCDYKEQKAFEVTSDLLKENKGITALFCASDMIAVGAMKAIRKLGLRIPEDISIVGYDNIPISEYLHPPLTTVAQDFYIMGYKAGEKLYKIITDQPDEKMLILEHKLLERESVQCYN